MPIWLVSLLAKPTARLVLGLTTIACVLLLLWGGYNLLTGSLKTKVKLGENQTDAAIKNGADAVNVVGSQAASEAASEDLTRRNTDDIRKADGAGAPVANGVNNAGLEALCHRTAYANSPRCIALRKP
jgi:hypothetical protein